MIIGNLNNFKPSVGVGKTRKIVVKIPTED